MLGETEKQFSLTQGEPGAGWRAHLVAAAGVAVLCGCLAGSSVSGAAFVWTKLATGNASGAWTNQGNWSGGTLPTTSSDSAAFNTLDITLDSTVTLNGNQTLNRLSFGDAASGTAASWLLVPGTPANSTLTLAGANPLILVNGMASGEAALLGAAVAGTNGLIKCGPNALQLTNANTYSGGTVLSNYNGDCRVSVGHNAAFGTGLVTVGATAGTGQIWFQPAGNRTLTNAFEIRTIRWIIDNATINGLAAGDLSLNGPVVLNMGSSNVRDIYCNGNLALNGNVSVTPASNPFNKQGGYTLTLNGTNTFTGPTAVNGGTLVVNGRIASSGSVTVNSGTLTGTGRLDGPVVAQGGASVAVGNDGSGTMTVGGLAPGATNAYLDFSLGSPTNAVNGFLQVNGNVTLKGLLRIRDLGGFTSGNYTSIWYSGTLTDLGLVPAVVPQGKTVTINTNTPHYVVFQALQGRLWPAVGEVLPMDLASALTLSWVQGPTALAYDLFLGTVSNSVFSATTNTAAVYRGRTTALTHTLGALSANTTCYWRVDSVDAAGVVTKGPVRRFGTGAPMADLMADTWPATDALGRTLPGNAECGDLRTNRPIGIFYWVWHGENGSYGNSGADFDNTKYIAAHPWTNPQDPWADNPVYQQVPSGRSFYWGEPELGYYSPKDPWVLRRHMQWLTEAGVDVLGFDFTNGHPWSMFDSLLALCQVLRQMRIDGYPTPIKLLFLTHADNVTTINWLYDNFFGPNLYPDLWFSWQGKPLLLGSPTDTTAGTTVRPEVQAFLTWRTTWANQSQLQHEWQWIDSDTPQNWGYDTDASRPEQVPVTCGGWSSSNLGHSFTNHTQPAYNQLHLPVSGSQGLGLFYNEQMVYGLKLDPEFLFLTGWNEWIAGSWLTSVNGWPSMLGQACPLGGFYFVDEYNQEYSRDIEPMAGGHSDNYYFQMVGQNRRRKGARPVPTASAPKTIDLAGDFSDWADVLPEYRDAPGDTAPRNHASSVASLPAYTNYTGRNDFTVLKAARDATYLYLLAQCNSNLTAPAGSNWMVLFIDADQNHATGWEGYDYAVNLNGTASASNTVLLRNLTVTNGWSWTVLRSDLRYKTSGNQLMVRVPRADLGLTREPLAFDFHWADNFQVLGQIADFGVSGDSAPDRRFNYRYQAENRQPVTLLQDDFESGKHSVWAESWNSGSKWNLTSGTRYSGTQCAVCSIANGTGVSNLIARVDTTALDNLRVSFRYKLHSAADAQNVRIQYYGTNGWVTARELGRDEYYPSGQKWSYDERQDVWMQFAETRYKAGTNAAFFHPGFALRIDGAGITASGQAVYIDDVLVTGSSVPSNQPPTLAAVSNRVLVAGQTLVLTNTASDPDLPAQTLAFRLLSAPSGATLDPAGGVFTWRPTMAQAPSVTLTRVAVSDSGTPPLSATQSFWTSVNVPVRPALSAPELSNGFFSMRIAGDSGPDYAIWTSSNLVDWLPVLTNGNALTPFLYRDPSPATDSPRFYRVQLGP